MGATKSQPLWLNNSSNNPSKLVKRVKYEYPESSIKSEYKSRRKPICSRIKNLFCKKVD